MKFYKYVKKRKAGIIPYIILCDTIYLMFMIPSNFEYGGSSPQIAKGEIDIGETSQEAALREMKEELGIPLEDVVSTKFFCTENSIDFYIVKLNTRRDNYDFEYETKKVVWLPSTNLLNVRRDQKSVIYNAVKKIQHIENVYNECKI